MVKLNDRPRRLEHDCTDLGGGHGYAQRDIDGRLFDNVSGVEGIRRKKGGKMEGLKEYILKEDAVRMGDDTINRQAAIDALENTKEVAR